MKIRNLLIAFLIPLSVFAQKNKPSDLPRPKLVVGIMVDQMRWDYLYRYYNRYENGGFKRMLNEGFSAENTQIDYATTVTAIGHTTVYTGSVPAFHGIAGNEFINQATGQVMYCAGDTTVQTVGSTSKAGQMSPRNLLTTTITDELKLATNFRSKVIGIALKDRGGILPAGHSANAAYWFDDASGGWISSTYYMQDLPDWVKKLNARKLPEHYLKQDWKTLYPENTYLQSSADDNRYEGKFSGTTISTLPLNTSELMKKSVSIIRSTPYGNSITLDMAKAAIDNENLGEGDVTDFLALSFSSTDYIGHQMGPNSMEVEDIYLRLDRDIANLLSFLDKKLGKGNYTTFLTADHGVAHNPNFLNDNKIPAGFWPTSQVLKSLNTELETAFKVKNLVLSFGGYQVSLNNKLIASEKLNETEIRKAAVNFLKTQPGVAFAIDIDQIQTAAIPQLLKERIVNAYNRERSGVIQIILKPGYYSGYSATGATHGSWNPYDSHIPLVFMGWGINHGKSYSPTGMTDIAATLAALLRIQMPNGSIGKPIGEAIK
ncbi:alkaline phosphatase family protein [Flavihumibacter sp. R14]|nr:alkaline phosphatase family protein [Flavihumibacter soli]